jgi:hypothetical protein
VNRKSLEGYIGGSLVMTTPQACIEAGASPSILGIVDQTETSALLSYCPNSVISSGLS